MEDQLSLLGMISGAGPMVKFVMLVLAGFSVASWAIILGKLKSLKRIERETSKFSDLFWEAGNFTTISSSAKSYKTTPLARLFEGVYTELISTKKIKGNSEVDGISIHTNEIGRYKRVLKKITNIEKAKMESTISFLATAGNTAPFIGLFGTVWGIMRSFRSIGVNKSASLSVVAPGISEALIATAIGLFVAIPAVIAYNHLLGRIDRLTAEMDNFSSDLLNIIEKQLIKRSTTTEQSSTNQPDTDQPGRAEGA
ncbi:MAG: protein TolQ [Thermodesulfobacteriota bacterium]